MWFNCDPCGLVAVLIGYATIACVYASVYLFVLKQGIENGDLSALIQISLFSLIVIMIFWTHIKTMTTQPG